MSDVVSGFTTSIWPYLKVEREMDVQQQLNNLEMAVAFVGGGLILTLLLLIALSVKLDQLKKRLGEQDEDREIRATVRAARDEIEQVADETLAAMRRMMRNAL